MRRILSAVSDTFSLVSFRSARVSWVGKLFALLFLALFLYSLYVALALPNAIHNFITSQLPNLPFTPVLLEGRKYVSGFFDLYIENDLSFLIIIIFLFLVGNILITLFIGQETNGVVSVKEVAPLSKTWNFRIGDSIFFHFLSSYSMVQILAMTIFARLITFDSPYGGRVAIIMWGIWVVFAFLGILISWVAEYLSRQVGSFAKYGLLFALIGTLVASALLNPEEAQTLFGATPIIQQFLQSVGAGNTELFLFSLAVLAVAIILILKLISFIATKALYLPDFKVKKSTLYKSIKPSDMKFSPIGFTSIIVNSIFRHKVINRQIISAVVMSAFLMAVLDAFNVQASILAIIPLSVAIAYGGNYMGLFTGAMKLLSSVPHGVAKAVVASNVAIIIVTMISFLAVWTPLFFIDGQSVFEFIDLLPGLLGLSVLTAHLSNFLSLRKPLPFYGEAKENIISSPVKIMKYIFLFLLAFTAASYVFTAIVGLVAWLVLIVITCLYIVHSLVLIDGAVSKAELLRVLR